MNARSAGQKKRRLKEFMAANPKPWPLCECGCGQEIDLLERRNKGTYGKGCYIHNHHRLKNSAEYVENSRGCWIWQRAVSGGYGTQWDTSTQRVKRAHRIYYERTHGPIDKGMFLHHKCEEPLCVNPDHLEPLDRMAHRHQHMEVDIAWVA